MRVFQLEPIAPGAGGLTGTGCRCHAAWLLCCRWQIVEGRLEKIKKNFALLEQPALRDNNKTVAEIIKETIAATGENIQVSKQALHHTLQPACCLCCWQQVPTCAVQLCCSSVQLWADNRAAHAFA